MRRIFDLMKALAGLGALIAFAIFLSLIFRAVSKEFGVGAPTTSPIEALLATPKLEAKLELTPTPTETLVPSPTPTETPLPTSTPTEAPTFTPTPPPPLRTEKIEVIDIRPALADEEVILLSWSPDGEKILYFPLSSCRPYILVRFPEGTTAGGGMIGALWLMNADGTGRRKLVERASKLHSAWSPDGRHLAYAVPVKEEGVEGELYVFDTQTFEARKVTSCDLGGGPDIYWLPSDEITFRRDGVMYAVKADRSEIRQLNEIFSSEPVVDPMGHILPPVRQGYYHISLDGRKIAYFKIHPISAIFIANLDGSGVTKVSPDGIIGGSSDFSWSPDGSKLAFVARNQRGRMGADLWVINSDGSDMRRVFSPEHEDEFVLYPSWSPDGNVIAFVYVSREGTSVWVVNEDGTNPRQLVESAYRPKWSPKGDEIAIMKMWGKVPFVGGDSSFIVSISF